MPSSFISRIGPFALVAIAMAVAGCSGSVHVGGEETVDKPDAEAFAQKILTQKMPDLPKAQSLACPGDINAKEGTTFQCTATLQNGQKVTIPMRVGAKSGDTVSMTINEDIISQANAVELIYRSLTSPAKAVDCPESLAASPGKTFECTATLKSGENLTLTLKSLDGGGIRLLGSRRS